MCALRLARIYNNSGPAIDDILYDLPILWFDQLWARGGKCLDPKVPVKCARWHQVAGNFYAMHTRYPKAPDAPKNSPIDRARRIIGEFFGTQCTDAGCLPLHGAQLIAYEGMADAMQFGMAGKMQLKQRGSRCHD